MLLLSTISKIVLTEADLQDYPGLHLTGSSENPDMLAGIFPHYPLKEEMTHDRDLKVTETADYMAKTYDLQFDG